MVRRIREDDLPVLLGLYGFLHPEEGCPDYRDGAVQKTWRAILADSNLRYYAAEADGRIVSTCALALIPNLTRGLRPYGLIENVVTDPAYRKRGFATRVIGHALTEAWATGCYKVMLLTGSKREETLRFYEKASFQRGVKTGFVLIRREANAYPIADAVTVTGLCGIQSMRRPLSGKGRK